MPRPSLPASRSTPCLPDAPSAAGGRARGDNEAHIPAFLGPGDPDDLAARPSWILRTVIRKAKRIGATGRPCSALDRWMVGPARKVGLWHLGR